MTTWRKSSYSDNGTCVEVGRAASDEIAARDSKNPEGPQLRFERPAFARLLDEIKAGKHNLT